MKVEEVVKQFKNEFNPILKKFKIIKVLNGQKMDSKLISEAKYIFKNKNIIAHPGVYVFYGNDNVYRIGRHLINSRLRVLQHIKDNTRNKDHKITDIKNHKDAEIILFNVIDRNDAHWVAAVEIYLERVLNPLIKSKRTG